MPKIIKTQGICLSSRKIRETSKIATFYTKNFGKLNFICKGARNPKSRFGASLELFTLSEIIFYKKEQKSIYTLSDTTLKDSYPTLKTLEKFFYASQIAELILRTTYAEDPNAQLFSLLVSTLHNLNSVEHKKKSNYMSLLAAYFLKAVTILGFKPELKHCVICKNQKVSCFSIDLGGVVCNSPTHTHTNNTYGINHIKSLSYLLNNPIKKSLNFSITKQTLDLVQNFLLFHLEKINLHSLNFN